jgi:signal transduction histidine kinase
MRERAATVDGTLTIATTAGQGTVVEAVVPIRRSGKEAV